VTADDIELLSDNALDDYFITQSPRPWTKAEVVEAFTSALNLESRSA
jgi:alcohol dehydrogenase